MSHPLFEQADIQELTSLTFDDELSRAEGRVTGVFFWGNNCPNCDVAKRMLLQEVGAFRDFGFNWFHVNVYENFDLGTRFALHGVPSFLFFLNGKKLGRISPFPGIDPFFEALRKLKLHSRLQ